VIDHSAIMSAAESGVRPNNPSALGSSTSSVGRRTAARAVIKTYPHHRRPIGEQASGRLYVHVSPSWTECALRR
jgi:hypothetical protein